MPQRSVDPIAKTIIEQISKKSKGNMKRILIPSGSLMLNLACSNTCDGAFETGRMVNLIGDSSSGKTYLALEMLAQLSHNPNFKDYALIYDDTEHALAMDIEGLFGKSLANRLMPPELDSEENPVYSRTIEDFHIHLLDCLEKSPCVYILDSFDALTSEQDESKIDEMREARKKGKEIAGSYRLAKPKKASEMLQDITSKLDKTQSLLLIISQTRDNINPMAFETKTRSGGRALKFYASHEIWLSVTGKIKAKERVVGAHLKAKVTKNKLTGAFREVAFDFKHWYGVDDISSAIEFLFNEKIIIGNSRNRMDWEGFSGSMSSLVKHIETNDLEEKLFKQTEEVWNRIEGELKPNRKKKYGD